MTISITLEPADKFFTDKEIIMFKMCITVILAGILGIVIQGRASTAALPEVTLKISVVDDAGTPIDHVNIQINKSKLNDKKNDLTRDITELSFDKTIDMPLDLDDYAWSIQCQAAGYHTSKIPNVVIAIYRIKEQLEFYTSSLESIEIPVTIRLKRIIGQSLISTSEFLIFDRRTQSGPRINIGKLLGNTDDNSVFLEMASPEDEGRESELPELELLPFISSFDVFFSGTIDGGFVQTEEIESLYALQMAPLDGYEPRIKISCGNNSVPLLYYLKVGNRYGKMYLERGGITGGGLIKIKVICVFAKDIDDRNLCSDDYPESLLLIPRIDLKDANLKDVNIPSVNKVNVAD